MEGTKALPELGLVSARVLAVVEKGGIWTEGLVESNLGLCLDGFVGKLIQILGP